MKILVLGDTGRTGRKGVAKFIPDALEEAKHTRDCVTVHG